MKHFVHLFIFAFSLNAFASVQTESVKLVVESGFHASEHGVISKSDNLIKIMDDEGRFTRTIDFPTQIVRIKGDISALKMTCDDVNKYTDKFFNSQIDPNRFYYNTLTHCGNDPQTELALSFSIDSYFDPLTDEAVAYLKDYLQSHNGQLFLGVPFKIENASGLAVSYNLDAGVIEDENAAMLVLRHDNESLYFPSNYDMLKYFVSDLYKNLYSNDPSIVLPFLSRWLGAGAGLVFGHVLPKSNYILVQPERIFLMKEGATVYTSPLRMYFASQCFKRYPNGKCM